MMFFKNAAQLVHQNDPEYLFLEIEEGTDTIPVKLSRHPRAKRLILKQDGKTAVFKITLPPYGSVHQAQEFIQSQKDWILKRYQKEASAQSFTPGQEVPLYGEKVTLTHDATRLRGLVKRQENHIIIPGDQHHFHRRFVDYIKTDLRHYMTPYIHDKASRIGKTVNRIRIADQKTRWASCSTRGTLSFSCRLIFTPKYVIDYIIAHEVAHLQHMNHSKDFWALCMHLCDDPILTDLALSKSAPPTANPALDTARRRSYQSGKNVNPAQVWLKENQAALMTYKI